MNQAEERAHLEWTLSSELRRPPSVSATGSRGSGMASFRGNSWLQEANGVFCEGVFVGGEGGFRCPRQSCLRVLGAVVGTESGTPRATSGMRRRNLRLRRRPRRQPRRRLRNRDTSVESRLVLGPTLAGARQVEGRNVLVRGRGKEGKGGGKCFSFPVPPTPPVLLAGINRPRHHLLPTRPHTIAPSLPLQATPSSQASFPWPTNPRSPVNSEGRDRREPSSAMAWGRASRESREEQRLGGDGSNDSAQEGGRKGWRATAAGRGYLPSERRRAREPVLRRATVPAKPSPWSMLAKASILSETPRPLRSACSRPTTGSHRTGTPRGIRSRRAREFPRARPADANGRRGTRGEGGGIPGVTLPGARRRCLAPTPAGASDRAETVGTLPCRPLAPRPAIGLRDVLSAIRSRPSAA